MKVRAAVAYEARKPLVIEDVELEGPKAGEVLVEIEATGVCHTDEFTLLGRRSRGPFPGRSSGTRAPASSSTSAPASRSLQAGRPRHSALHAGVPRMQIVPQPQDEPLHRDPRHAGQGPHARRHEPLLDRRKKVHHYMGCSTFSNFTVLPEIALAKIRDGRAVRQGLLHRLRRHDRHRRGHQHGQGRARRERRRLRPRRHRAQRRPGRAHRRRRHDRRRRHQPRARGARARSSG